MLTNPDAAARATAIVASVISSLPDSLGAVWSTSEAESDWVQQG